MSKFKITRLDVKSNLVDSAPTISMDIAVFGGMTYSDVSNLRKLIEDENSDWCRTHVGVSRGNGKTKYFSDWDKYVLTTTDRFEIKQVIFNSPATIVFWADGTKTVVKCQDGDKFIPETGLAMCFMKKVLGNKSNFNNTFKKWIKDKTIGDLFNELSKDEQKKIAKHILSEPVSGRYDWKSDGKKKPITRTYAHLDTEVVYRILRENKWTVKELAKAVGVDHTSVYHWLKGGGIKKRTLNKLSKVLYIPEEDLVK